MHSAASMLLWGHEAFIPAGLSWWWSSLKWGCTSGGTQECALPLEWDLSECIVPCQHCGAVCAVLQRPALNTCWSSSLWRSCIKRSWLWHVKMLSASCYWPWYPWPPSRHPCLWSPAGFALMIALWPYPLPLWPSGGIFACHVAAPSFIW